MRSWCSTVTVVLLSGALAASSSARDARATDPPPAGRGSGDPATDHRSVPALDLQPGAAMLEVAPDLSAANRERLWRELSSMGLTLADLRPDGFPEAGSAQDLRQNVWAMNYDERWSFTEIRSRVLSWRDAGAGGIGSSLLGILPGYRNRDDGSPLCFRPAAIVVMLAPQMAFDRVADSIADRPWLSVAADSLPQPAFTRYVWRRLQFRVAPSVGVFAALDSLRGLPWIRAASPMRVDGGDFLPVIPRVPAMRELAVGTLRKLKPLEMVVIAHTCRVDGPEAAVEAARNGTREVDSLGRIRVVIEVRGAYEDLAPTLEGWGAEVIAHESRDGGEVSIVTLLPCKWLAVCTAIRSVRNIYPYEDVTAHD